MLIFYSNIFELRKHDVLAFLKSHLLSRRIQVIETCKLDELQRHIPGTQQEGVNCV